MTDKKKEKEKLKYLDLDEIVKDFEKHSDVEKAANEIKKFSDKYDALILEEAKDISQNFYDGFKSAMINKIADGDLANIDIAKETVGKYKKEMEESLAEIAEKELQHLDKRHYHAVTKHLSKDKKKDYVLKRYAMSLGIREEGLTKLIENSSSKTIQEFLDELTQLKSHFQKGVAQSRLGYTKSSLGHNLKEEDVIKYIHTEVPKTGFKVNMDELHKHDHLTLIENVVHDHMNKKLDEDKHRPYGITGSYKTKK